MLNFLWLALGLSSLLVALVLCLLLLRLNRTLAVLEETLITADAAIRETIPEVRGSLGNVNDITAGVNVALRAAGDGANRSRRSASAALYGARVAVRSLWDWYGRPRDLRGGRADGQ